MLVYFSSAQLTQSQAVDHPHYYHYSMLLCKNRRLFTVVGDNSHVLTPIPMGSQSSPFPCTPLLVMAAHEVPASFVIRLFLLFSFTALHDRCPSLKGSGLKWHQDTLGRGPASDVDHSCEHSVHGVTCCYVDCTDIIWIYLQLMCCWAPCCGAAAAGRPLLSVSPARRTYSSKPAARYSKMEQTDGQTPYHSQTLPHTTHAVSTTQQLVWLAGFGMAVASAGPYVNST